MSEESNMCPDCRDDSAVVSCGGCGRGLCDGKPQKTEVESLRASLRASEEKLAVAEKALGKVSEAYDGDEPSTKPTWVKSCIYALSLISNPALLDLVSAREKVIEAAIRWNPTVRAADGTPHLIPEAQALVDALAALKAVTEKA